jgi:ATP-dependent helicase/nuclease subunit B
MSASALERLGRCPRLYFYSSVLRIAPAEDLTVDPTQWLDPAESGSLLHELFRRFMAALSARGERPSFARHSAELFALLDEVVSEYAREIPPPSESVFRMQLSGLKRTARVFLIEEEELCRECAPYCLEAAVGIAQEGDATPLDARAPVSITLAKGRTLRARGRIDRVDVIGDEAEGAYGIWDYKTGGVRAFDQSDPFMQGRLVQPALYVAIVQARLRVVVSRQARIARFGYFYPGLRGGGERSVFPAETLAGGAGVLDALCRLAASGAYCATDDVNDCRYCDYASVCGDTATVVSESKSKLADADNSMLDVFRALRGAHGEEEEQDHEEA